MSKPLRLSGKERSQLYATIFSESHGLHFLIAGFKNVAF